MSKTHKVKNIDGRKIIVTIDNVETPIEAPTYPNDSDLWLSDAEFNKQLEDKLNEPQVTEATEAKVVNKPLNTAQVIETTKKVNDYLNALILRNKIASGIVFLLLFFGLNSIINGKPNTVVNVNNADKQAEVKKAENKKLIEFCKLEAPNSITYEATVGVAKDDKGSGTFCIPKDTNPQQTIVLKAVPGQGE